MRTSLSFAVMNSVEPSPPKPQLAVGTPVTIVPRCLPVGSKTQTPPGPVANRLPFASTFKPSGPPGFFALTAAVQSWNTLPSPRVPSAFTGKLFQIGASESELAT